MRLDTSQQMRMDQRLRMAPRMIQSMEILQLPLMALQERVDQELIENPVLVDMREEAPLDPEAMEAREAEKAAEEAAGDAELEAYLTQDWADEAFEASRPSRAALREESDRKQEAMQNMAARPRRFMTSLRPRSDFSIATRPCDSLPATSSTTWMRTDS